jgi:hypothetical protein
MRLAPVSASKWPAANSPAATAKQVRARTRRQLQSQAGRQLTARPHRRQVALSSKKSGSSRLQYRTIALPSMPHLSARPPPHDTQPPPAAAPAAAPSAPPAAHRTPDRTNAPQTQHKSHAFQKHDLVLRHAHMAAAQVATKTSLKAVSRAAADLKIDRAITCILCGT